jgi:hypothetical protein
MKPNNNFPSEIREGKDLVLHYSPTAHRRLKDTDDVKDIDTFGGTFNVKGMFFPHEPKPTIKPTKENFNITATYAGDPDPLYKNPDIEKAKKNQTWKRNPDYK